MKFACISDLHLDNHLFQSGPYVKGLNTRCIEQLKVLFSTIKYLQIQNIPLFIAGDLFHTSKPIPSLYRAVHNIFKTSIPITLITGNHDYRVDIESSAMEALRVLDNVSVVTTSQFLSTLGIGLIPFVKTKEEFMQNIEILINNAKLSSCNISYIITHFGLINQGSILLSSADYIDYETLSNLYPNITFISGHNHTPFQKKNIYNLGTYTPFSFSDRGIERSYLYIFNTDTSSVETIEMPGARFLYEHEIDLQQDLESYIKKGYKIYTKKIPEKLTKTIDTKLYTDSISNIQMLIDEYIINTCPEKLDKKEIINILKSKLNVILTSNNLLSYDIYNIEEIIIQNFLSYSDITLKINPTGLTLIQGDNGAGKSTIIEAIVYCLWGEILRGKICPVKYNTAFCCVTVILKSKQQIIKLTRKTNKDNKTTLCIESSLLSEKITRLTEGEEWLCNIIGSFKQFKAGHIYSRFTLDSFTSLSDSERKELLEKLLNLTILDSVYQEFKKLHLEQEFNKTNKERELNYKKEQLLYTESKIDELGKEQQRIKQQINKYISVNNIQDCKNILNELQAEVVKNEDELNQLDANNILIDTELSKIQSNLQLSYIPEFEKAKAELQLELKKKEKVLSVDAICPTCQRILSIEERDNILKAINATTEVLQFTVEKANKAQESIQDQQRLIKQKQQAILLTKRGLIQETERIRGEIRKIEYKIKEQELVTTEEIGKQKGQLNNIEKNLLEQKKFMKELKLSLESIQDDLRHFQERVNYYAYLLEVTSKKGIRAYILEKILSVMKAIVNKDLSESMLPGYEMEIEVDTTGRLLIYFIRQDVERKILYQTLSDGEKRRIDFLILRSLSIVAQIGLFKSGINIMFYDEVLDVVDIPGIQLFSKILKEESKILPVLIISHNEDLQEYLQADDLWKIENSSTGSILKIY